MTPGRRAAMERYNASEKRRATNARYYASVKGQAARARGARGNQRRLYVGRRYVGFADSSESATAINAHIQERVRDFKTGQRDNSLGGCRVTVS